MWIPNTKYLDRFTKANPWNKFHAVDVIGLSTLVHVPTLQSVETTKTAI